MNLTHLLEKVIFEPETTELPISIRETWTIERALWRLREAKKTNPNALLDHAVLTRQCLRWLSPEKLRAGRLGTEQLQALEKVGVRLSLGGYLEVTPFRPNWLGESAHSVDIDSRPVVAGKEESIEAEEWLDRTTGKRSWRSPAQKEACWKVLVSQPGDTNLIGLPTGAGKSLSFQIAAALSPGLTLVVVPTVALGLDQLTVAKALPTAGILNPAAYDSGDGASAIRDLVENRQCRLLFASPEACVSGRLRSTLDRHANDGWLKWVVVDEAHIVESWGADFRIEFQLLGALVREWRKKSSNSLRTLLLSATFSDSTQNLLRNLFVEPSQPWGAHVVQRLRPEIQYHINRAGSPYEQTEAIKDALLHLPRPMILYVTEKAEAQRWYELAKSMGFSRVDCFHGDTPREERKRIMNQWRSDHIDLIIATSAFGMGVDKPDVRVVLHACFPESIDRYYQEVGRGGRDGATTHSILIYTDSDKRVGKRLAPRLLLPDTVNDRWGAIWASRRALGVGARFQVRCDARREQFVGVRTYQENVRWNKRLLQMLHRAKLLNLTGLASEKATDDSDEYVEWVTIEDLKFPTIDPDIGTLLGEVRSDEISKIQAGFNSLENCASGKPVCRELCAYYGRDVVRACGSCRACRTGTESKRFPGALEWPTESGERGINTRVYVVPVRGHPSGKGRADWILAIRKTIDQQIARRFVVAEQDRAEAISLFRDAIGTSTARIYRLDWEIEKTLPSFDSHEQLVALHPSQFRAELSVFNRCGKVCSHWMPATELIDEGGRSRFTHPDAARQFEGVESWIFESAP